MNPKRYAVSVLDREDAIATHDCEARRQGAMELSMRVHNHRADRKETIVADRELIQKFRQLKAQGAAAKAKGAAGRMRPSTQSASQAEDHHPNQLEHRISVEAHQNGMGLVLADLSFKPIYACNGATSILYYPAQPDGIANQTTVQQRIRSILQTDRFIAGWPPREFLSGRRRYVCRSFFVECFEGARPLMVALMLERPPRDPLVLSDVGRRFHLSLREIETVQHLIHGLTTKEAAQCMNISPNTVKQFVRFIMSKMGVTTRSGIIGKLVGG